MRNKKKENHPRILFTFDVFPTFVPPNLVIFPLKSLVLAPFSEILSTAASYEGYDVKNLQYFQADGRKYTIVKFYLC